LGKGLAWADIAFSGTETVMHTVKAFNSSGETRNNAIFDAIGSAGSVIRSAGAIAGPTPLGFGLMAVGTAMGIVSWGYKHRNAIKTAWDWTKNTVKSGAKYAWKGAKWLGNKVKGWFS